jgi:tight adherence protein C
MNELAWDQRLWMPLLCAAGLGLSVGYIVLHLIRAVDDVPPDDRTWRDKPPIGFRIVWWPTRWMAHYLGPLLSPAFRQRWLGKLRIAGLDYALAPEQFVAGRLICGAAGALVCDFVLASFGRPWSPWIVAAALAGYGFPRLWLRDRILLRRAQTLKTLPFMLDIITLCVEAGLNLSGALTQAVAKGPGGPLRDELSRVLRDMRAGRTRIDALRMLSDRMGEASITNLVSALITAEQMGMSLGPVLRAQSEQRRNERFARAEKLAMEAPVKLLFPLLAFIFPCTFIIISFPLVMKFMASGMF